MYSSEFTSKVEEVLECVSEGKGGWGTHFARISFNNQPSKLNLRNMNIETERNGSGIALTDEVWNNVANALIRMGFGDMDVIKEELTKRESRISTEGQFFNE